MSSTQSRRKRLHEWAVRLDGQGLYAGDDIRALLASERELRRELSIRRGIERELFALTEGMMDAQCPPWAKGDEPEECPCEPCSKC